MILCNLTFPLISVGKISAQPHTTLCIQFLNRENSDKNNTFPSGKQICFTIVWGCTETLPKIFYSLKRTPEMQSSSQIFFPVPAMEQEKLLGRRSVITIEPRMRLKRVSKQRLTDIHVSQSTSLTLWMNSEHFCIIQTILAWKIF